MQTVEVSRNSLAEAADKIFLGYGLRDDGSSLLTDIIYLGTFLPAGRDGEVGYYHSGQMEALVSFPQTLELH